MLLNPNGPRPGPRWKDYRVFLAVGVALAVGLLAWLFFPPQPAPAARSAFGRDRGLDVPPAPPAEPARRPSGGLYSAQPMSLDRLKAIFAELASPELAAEVAAAVEAEPALKKAHEEFKASAGPDAPAAEFLQKVAELPEFQKVLNRFTSDPGFSQLWQQLASRADVNRLMREDLPAALARGKAAPGGAGLRASSGAGGSGRAGRYSALAPGGQGEGSRRILTAFAPLSGGGGRAGAQGTEATLARAGGQPSGSGGPGNDIRAAGRADGFASSSGGGAIGKFGAINAAGPGKDAALFLESVLGTMPKNQLDLIVDQCIEHDICDPISACAAAGLFDACKTACAKSPKCNGVVPFPPAAPVTETATGSGTTTATDTNTGTGTGTAPIDLCAGKTCPGNQQCIPSNGRCGCLIGCTRDAPTLDSVSCTCSDDDDDDDGGGACS